ncbi:MAG: hypothetical protein EOO38_23840 [Cytophagaceae bacterium]|nr:MAG: hypothetical protein EOO38_23840 [Cytophagaceae bacterium]
MTSLAIMEEIRACGRRRHSARRKGTQDHFLKEAERGTDYLTARIQDHGAVMSCLAVNEGCGHLNGAFIYAFSVALRQ